MKTYDVEVSRSVTTTIRVRVPDDFEPADLMHQCYGRVLGQVADGQVGHMDWDDSDKSVQVHGVTRCEDDGEFPSTDVTAAMTAVDADMARLRADYARQNAAGQGGR